MPVNFICSEVKDSSGLLKMSFKLTPNINFNCDNATSGRPRRDQTVILESKCEDIRVKGRLGCDVRLVRDKVGS